ncbi:MAG: aspartate 1-decarboxylase [Candidatus Schekmanbacteria bacterium RBG_13_48_7]|uniref:Aspartate 1-decarboxylase n=1 Tax=Candidatus Schekmanbacteria bacterium RBG_13_48_7 TaxID=1817878 RepID=A0A1F7RPI2_9BACT|nr:MAG: aspartate 1-decarboxylase [Candidatus Schekmanbacteria bacterium RBG_13_48_7]
MSRCMLKSKIHRATVTEVNIEYEGSLTLDAHLMKMADLFPFEKVSIYNITNGNRFDTYLIKGEPGSGTICVNGAAAHLATPGDIVIIASYTWVPENKSRKIHPIVVLVDTKNKIVETKNKM